MGFIKFTQIEKRKSHDHFMSRPVELMHYIHIAIRGRLNHRTQCVCDILYAWAPGSAEIKTIKKVIFISLS